MPADLARLETALRNADAAGDKAAAQTLATEIRRQRNQVTPPPVAPGAAPTVGQMLGVRDPRRPQAKDVQLFEGNRLNTGISALINPFVHAATAVPDFATQVANLVPESIAGPKATPPGQFIDQFLTQPESRTAKVSDFISNMLASGMAGPKTPRVSDVSPTVRRLANEGVVTTPGMRAGNFGSAIEQKAAAILPPVKSARATAVQQWNTARLNEALRHAGAPPLRADLTGRDAIRETYQALQRRYDQVLSRVRGDLNAGPAGAADARLPVARGGQNWAPGSFRDQLERIRAVGQNLDERERRALNDIIDRQVIGKFTAAGRASGTTIKEISETLRTAAESARSGDYQQRAFSQAVRQIQADLRQMIARVNPREGQELDGLDRGYAQYKLSARASNYAKSRGGGYTPAQRLQAVAARDKSKNKNAFSTGTAQGQQEAEETQRVLGNTEPDSGTPFGMALLSLGMGGGAALSHNLPAIGTAAASPLLYSQPVLRYLQNRALSQGPTTLSRPGMLGTAAQRAAPTLPVDEAGVAQ